MSWYDLSSQSGIQGSGGFGASFADDERRRRRHHGAYSPYEPVGESPVPAMPTLEHDPDILADQIMGYEEPQQQEAGTAPRQVAAIDMGSGAEPMSYGEEHGPDEEPDLQALGYEEVSDTGYSGAGVTGEAYGPIRAVKPGRGNPYASVDHGAGPGQALEAGEVREPLALGAPDPGLFSAAGPVVPAAVKAQYVAPRFEDTDSKQSEAPPTPRGPVDELADAGYTRVEADPAARARDHQSSLQGTRQAASYAGMGVGQKQKRGSSKDYWSSARGEALHKQITQDRRKSTRDQQLAGRKQARETQLQKARVMGGAPVAPAQAQFVPRITQGRVRFGQNETRMMDPGAKRHTEGSVVDAKARVMGGTPVQAQYVKRLTQGQRMQKARVMGGTAVKAQFLKRITQGDPRDRDTQMQEARVMGGTAVKAQFVPRIKGRPKNQMQKARVMGGTAVKAQFLKRIKGRPTRPKNQMQKARVMGGTAVKAQFLKRIKDRDRDRSGRKLAQEEHDKALEALRRSNRLDIESLHKRSSGELRQSEEAERNAKERHRRELVTRDADLALHQAESSADVAHLRRGMDHEKRRAEEAQKDAAHLRRGMDHEKRRAEAAQREIDDLQRQLAAARKQPDAKKDPEVKAGIKALAQEVAHLKQAAARGGGGGGRQAPIVVGPGGGGSSSGGSAGGSSGGGTGGAGPAGAGAGVGRPSGGALLMAAKRLAAKKKVDESSSKKKKKKAPGDTKGITQARRAYTDKRKQKMAEARSLKSKRIREFNAKTKQLPKADRDKQRREYKKKVEAQYKEVSARFPNARGVKSVDMLRQLVAKLEALKVAT